MDLILFLQCFAEFRHREPRLSREIEDDGFLAREEIAGSWNFGRDSLGNDDGAVAVGVDEIT